ncbi:hypothetical protein AB1N83_004943 [Pleurotus pulmonarius]
MLRHGVLLLPLPLPTSFEGRFPFFKRSPLVPRTYGPSIHQFSRHRAPSTSKREYWHNLGRRNPTRCNARLYFSVPYLSYKQARQCQLQSND